MAIYFYHGDEDYNIEQAILERKKSLDKNFASMNFRNYDNPKFSELIEALRTQPMMFGKMLVVINCADYFSKTFEDKELDEISAALENNPESLDIVFVAKLPRNENKKLDSRKKLYKILSKYNMVEFPTFRTYKVKEIEDWLKKEATKRDIKLSSDAMTALIEQIGNNLREFCYELDKLKLFCYPEKNITGKNVREVCISNDDLFNFTTLLMEGKKDKALLEFRKLTDKKHPLEILSVIQTLLRKWITIKYNSRNMSAMEISKFVGMHEFVVKTNIAKMKEHNLRDMIALKQNLLQAEYRIKTGEAIDITGEVENAIMR